GLGRVEAQHLVVGGRQLDELERRERGSVALPAHDELLHGAAARCRDPGEELLRRRRADVVDGDEVGLQVLELLLQRFGGRARDEELALVVADLTADLVLLGREVLVLVVEELRRERRLCARRCPCVGGFGSGAEAADASLGRRGRSGRRRRGAPGILARLARLHAGRLPLVDLVLGRRLGTRRRPLLGTRRSGCRGLRRVARELAAVARIA